MANQLQDDGFHEIQLNGKQLVFLFMAATVVSVVIFLCGVLVGRGVRAERGLSAEQSSASVDATLDAAPSSPAPPPAGSDPTTVATPPPPADDLSYFQRLEKQSATKEQLREKPGTAAPARESAPAPAPAPTPDPPTASAPPSAAEPAGSGYAVQIAALNVRGEADAIAKRLTSKGYAAYVLAPANGTPSVFRVRVGKFSTKHEAETIAAKLKKEEQFNPWVTR